MTSTKNGFVSLVAINLFTSNHIIDIINYYINKTMSIIGIM